MAETGTRRWPTIELRVRSGARVAELDPELDERLAVALDGLDATAVDQSDDGTHRIYFADAEARRAAAALLEDQLGGLCSVTAVDVADEGWLQKVQAALCAVRVGRFVVAPPWDVPPGASSDPTSLLVVIEPSMGFGTGHHESTRLCLSALEKLGVERCRVIDVGTGSGLLGIAAAKLGATRVVAIDVDPDAVASARENVERNGVAEVVEVTHADLAGAPLVPADVVLANLTAVMLARHARALSGLVTSGGTLVTSGFTSDQVATVSDAFPDLEAVGRRCENGWECVVFRRP